MPATAPLDLVPATDAAAELGVSTDYLASLVARRRLAGVRPTPRCLLIRRADLDAHKRARAAFATAARKADGLTVREVADACNVGAESVRRWIRLGILPAKLHPALLGFRSYRVRPADLEAFLAGASVE